MKLDKMKAGEIVDLLYTTKQERLEIQKKVAELENQEKEIKAWLINNLPKSEASGISGKLARVSIVTKEEPTIVDEKKFRRFINKTKRYELAYKLRPAGAAIKEAWEEGEEIPGIGPFTVVSVSMNKL